MEKVRPAYKLPDPLTMSSSIFSDIHEEAILKPKSQSLKEVFEIPRIDEIKRQIAAKKQSRKRGVNLCFFFWC